PYCSRNRRQRIRRRRSAAVREFRFMRRALVTAVAVAPLLASLAGAAFAACPSRPSSTGGSDIELPSGCTVKPTSTQPGVTLNSSNKVVVDSGATISATDVDNAVGIKVLGGNT